MRLLLADDDELLCRSMAAGLLRDGHDVTAVLDGRDAVRAAAQARFDVAILDWVMPWSGAEACAALRRGPGGSGLYVMFLTARGEDRDVLTGVDVGADEYVVKPVRADELCRRVRAAGRFLAARAARATAEHAPALERDAMLRRIDDAAHQQAFGAPTVGLLRAQLDNALGLAAFLGADEAERLMQEVVARAVAACFGHDCGRTDGDELCVLVDDGPTEARLCALGRRIISAVGQAPVRTARGALRVSVSVDVIPLALPPAERLLGVTRALARPERRGTLDLVPLSGVRRVAPGASAGRAP